MDSAATILQLRPTAPLRPPGWRWQAAAHWKVLKEESSDPPSAPDAYVALAADIQLALDKARTETEKACALLTYGPIADAYAFWMAGKVASGMKTSDAPDGEDGRMYGPLSENALALAELEGLVLARKTPEQIARRTGLPPLAVTWYERLWFDVRDRLCRPGWIATNVIGSLHQGSVGTLLPALIRAYGFYSRSIRVVATAASGFDAVASRRAARETPEKYFAQDAIAAGGLKAALAIRMMPITDRKTYGRVVELHQEALRIQADTVDPEAGTDQTRYREVFDKFRSKVNMAFNGGSGPLSLPASVRLANANADDDADVG